MVLYCYDINGKSWLIILWGKSIGKGDECKKIKLRRSNLFKYNL